MENTPFFNASETFTNTDPILGSERNTMFLKPEIVLATFSDHNTINQKFINV